MPLIAPKPQSTFKPLDEGSYAARIYSIVDLGTHSESYQGGEPSDKRKIRIAWEIPSEVKMWEKDGKQYEAPYAISQEYTLSMGARANLRKHIELMTTTLTDEEAYGFDVFSLVGMTCMLSVFHKESKGNLYANISTVTRLPKGMTCGEPFNEQVVFDTQAWDEAVFQKLPKFMQEKINASMERNGQENKANYMKAHKAVMEDGDTEPVIPF